MNRLLALDFDGVLIPDCRRPYNVAIDDVAGAVELFDPDSVASVRELARDWDCALAITSTWLRGQPDPDFYRSLFARLGLDEPLVPDTELWPSGSHYEHVVGWFEGLGIDHHLMLWLEDSYVSPGPDNARWVARQYRPPFGKFTDHDRSLADAHMQLLTGDGRFTYESRYVFQRERPQ